MIPYTSAAFHVRMQEWTDYNVKQIKHFVADIKPLSYTVYRLRL